MPTISQSDSFIISYILARVQILCYLLTDVKESVIFFLLCEFFFFTSLLFLGVTFLASFLFSSVERLQSGNNGMAMGTVTLTPCQNKPQSSIVLWKYLPTCLPASPSACPSALLSARSPASPHLFRLCIKWSPTTFYFKLVMHIISLFYHEQTENIFCSKRKYLNEKLDCRI